MWFWKKKSKKVPFEATLTTSFVAGAAAGLVVDVALFPLDTLKTRLQGPKGFWKSGGFRGIYQGIGPVVIAAAPTASIFFLTYNALKKLCKPYSNKYREPIINISSASIAETVSCIVRVPSEVVKQRRQACINDTSAMQIAKLTLRREGIIGLYRGFMATIMRDIPYAAIQFPLWELFKKQMIKSKKGHHVTPAEGATCGALAGAVAGALTTPLDVVKTRQMLFEGKKKKRPPTFLTVSKWIYKDRGILGFFSGFVPRVTWIFLGGGLFFGVYEEVCSIIQEEED